MLNNARAPIGGPSVNNQQDPTATAEVADTDEATEVQRAFRLGWNFAQIYRNLPINQHISTDQPPKVLPGAKDLDEYDRGELLIRQIGYDVKALTDRSGHNNETNIWRSTIEAISASRPEGTDVAKRRKIHEAYHTLRIELGASDPHIGTALDLGRMLADTVAPNTSDVLMENFSEAQLSYACGLLDDLHTSFSDNAADVVKGSLRSWEKWVKRTSEIADRQHADPINTLRHQGEIWRRILCGEMRARDLLTSEGYRRAAAHLLSRLRGLAVIYLQRWWYIAISLLVVVGLATWGIVAYSSGGTAAIVALIATGAGALGISWKTIASTLGKVSTMAEGPLWDTEVLQAIIVDATITPDNPKAHRIAVSIHSARPKQALPPASVPVPAGSPAN
jgi:hypothetical protein